MSRDVLKEVIENFSEENLTEYFRQSFPGFGEEKRNLQEYQDDEFSSVKKIGEIRFSDDEKVGVFLFQSKNHISSRSSKKRQYEKAKSILKDTYLDGGIFVFSDDEGNFRFSLVYAEYKGTRREFSTYKRFTYYVSREQKNSTFLRQLGGKRITSLQELQEAFSIEKVTEEFFEAYKHAINNIIIPSLDQNIDYNKRHSFAQLFLSRIFFLYFLQKKNWLKWRNYEQDSSYIKNLWQKYKNHIRENKDKKDTFYPIWLSSLFFGAFNKKLHLISRELPEEIRKSFSIMPYLNGGLFSETELDRLEFRVPDSVFEWLFEFDPTENERKRGFLETFNFTIDESLPLDVEVAIDPEMLGKVYESLIAEEERGSGGIFYTPRIEIDFMSRMSLCTYLSAQTGIQKDKIIDFVFDPHEKANLLSKQELQKVKSALENVKIVDPACGSASFLVGIMNVLLDLHCVLTKQIENKEENLFALKQHILQENLYGVDVKDWAVMVGELRLWLSLIIETDEKYMDIYTRPLLPNLSFKIRQGDSLVEEIGEMLVSLRGDSFRYLPPSIEGKIRELIDRKNAFFSGQRSADLREREEIETLEIGILKEIINFHIQTLSQKIDELEQQKSALQGQGKLFHEGIEPDRIDQKGKQKEVQIEEIRKEKEKYQRILTTIAEHTKKDYFLWEVDFAEVFAERGGFDIVIGNPPYVRQELIAPPLANQDDYSDERWRELKSQYKEKLIASVKNIWRTVQKIDKKSDLYVYFYYHGLSLLRPGGIFCFINSNSWLDVGYGAGLQEFLLQNMRPLFIIDNLKKRSFKQADVNTVIVFIQRPEEKLEDYTVKFVAFKKPFEEVHNAEVIKKIERTMTPLFDDEDCRIFPKTRKELLLEGVEIEEEQEINPWNSSPENLPYIGNKWGGKYLRAPEIYFKILEKGKGKLVRLGDIAEVRRGFTTGANEFFYLKPVELTVKEVAEISEKNPEQLIRVKNGAGWEGEIEAEFLKPVIKSPRELKTIMVKLEDLNYLVFMCHKPEKELKGTKAYEYIKWGEKQGFNKRPTCKGRPRWWDLGEWEVPHMIWSDAYNSRYIVPEVNSFADKRFFYIYFHLEKQVELTKIYLNSSIISLFVETEGISNLGEGVIYTNVYWLNNLPVLKKEKKSQSLKDYHNKEQKNIFTELGFDPNKPIREQEPNPLPDRKALDDIVFDVLGLSEEERKEVYWAVAELVKNRLEKARSVR